MFLIKCPWCGMRDEKEFSYGGEAHIKRPRDPEKMNDQEWADYLFMRKNTKGKFLERWHHSYGCRQWFNIQRDTLSHDIKAVYKIGETPPRTSGGNL